MSIFDQIISLRKWSSSDCCRIIPSYMNKAENDFWLPDRNWDENRFQDWAMNAKFLLSANYTSAVSTTMSFQKFPKIFN